MTPLAILQRRWKLILAGACAGAVAAVTASLFLPKIYRATTYVLVSESKIGEPSGDSNLQQMAMLPTFLPFLDNDELIDASIRKFGLDRPPHSMTVDRFRRNNHLDVRIPKSTRLMELRLEFPDAQLAADLANHLAQAAVELNGRLNASDATATQQFLRKELDAAEEAFRRAAEQRLRAHTDARIEDREKELTILLGEKERLAGRLEELRQNLAEHEGRAQSLTQALAGEPVAILLKKSITSDRFLEKAAESLIPDEPPLSLVEESLNPTRETIRRELVEATASAAAERAGVQTATARLGHVNRQIHALLAVLAALRSELAAVDQHYALAAEAVKNASREYQTASVTVSSKSQELKQIAPALVPERPVRPNFVLNAALGLLLGAVVSASVAVVWSLRPVVQMVRDNRAPAFHGKGRL